VLFYQIADASLPGIALALCRMEKRMRTGARGALPTEEETPNAGSACTAAGGDS